MLQFCIITPFVIVLVKLLYWILQEVAPDHTVKLDRVGADIPIVRRHGSSFRRLTLIGSDGSQRHFIVQTSLTPNARSDERILQLFRVMNQMFDKHKEARRRHICIHTPIIIPVWSQVPSSPFYKFCSFFKKIFKWIKMMEFIFLECASDRVFVPFVFPCFTWNNWMVIAD